jgi:hypothetical protein
MGLPDLYEFDLVPVDDDAVIAAEAWPRVHYLLVEFQPAKTATLLGDPPRTIRVVGYGGTEVASGLLQKISEAAGTPLRVTQA